MPEYGDIVTTITVVFMVLSGLIVIDKVVDIYTKYRDRADEPRTEMKAELSDIHNELNRHQKCLDDNKMQLDKQNDAIKLLLRGLSQLMTHEIDGNHIDQLTKARDDMNEYLINKV